MRAPFDPFQDARPMRDPLPPLSADQIDTLLSLIGEAVLMGQSGETECLLIALPEGTYSEVLRLLSGRELTEIPGTNSAARTRESLAVVASYLAGSISAHARHPEGWNDEAAG